MRTRLLAALAALILAGAAVAPAFGFRGDYPPAPPPPPPAPECRDRCDPVPVAPNPPSNEGVCRGGRAC